MKTYTDTHITFFLRVGCRLGYASLLSTSMCILEDVQCGIFLHNHSIVIKTNKTTLIFCYLIYRPYLNSPNCPNNALYRKPSSS